MRVLIAGLCIVLVGIAPAQASDSFKELSRERNSATQEIKAGRTQLDTAVQVYEQARSEVAAAGRLHKQARDRLAAIEQQREKVKAVFAQRASLLYRGRGVNLFMALVNSDSLATFWRRLKSATQVLQQDGKLIAELEKSQADASQARQEAERYALEVHAKLKDVRRMRNGIQESLGALEAKLGGINREIKRVEDEIEAARLAKEHGALEQAVAGPNGIVFPVRPPYSFVDTFGAPRMMGTVYEHAHEGQDIFASYGTPVLATVDGTIEGVGESGLGGRKLWLRGTDGNRYYYAHLSGWAPSATNGTLVQAGTELGYVGDSGNARGTSPHLHFEVHLPSGVINPFGLLKAAEAAWTSP